MEAKEQLEIARAAIEHASQRAKSAAATLRDVEILFYGMACFEPLGKGLGYRVLFPNGMTSSPIVPAHAFGLWVRDRSEMATARWSGVALENDFFLAGKQKLTITGVTTTPLATGDFEDRVVVLKDCDASFKIEDPDAVVEMIVDHGTLSAHYVNNQNMIVVRWLVKAEERTPLRFSFGGEFVEIPPTATQVFLANAEASNGTNPGDNHFRLYRKLTKDPTKDLKHKSKPNKDPLPIGSLTMKDPTFVYSIMTPDIVCSPVQSELS